jgi:hypothetical protein
MNYTEEINTILRKKDIWGKDITKEETKNIFSKIKKIKNKDPITINKCTFEKVKTLLQKNSKEDLNRIILLSESMERDEVSFSSSFIGTISILIALVLPLLVYISDILNITPIFTFVIIIYIFLFFIGIIGLDLLYIQLKNRDFNKRIKCIQISTKEILNGASNIELVENNSSVKNSDKKTIKKKEIN